MNQITNIKQDLPVNEEIKIFGTKNGINVIESPIKAKILSLLKNNKGLNGFDIVVQTGKSKSTISAHLKDLIKAEIVDYRTDPIDGRRKIFYIKSRYLGTISRESELENGMDDYLQRQITYSDDPFKFYKYILRTIRVSLMQEGVNIDPILHNAGFKVGQTFNDQLKNCVIENLLENLSKFWEKNKLGQMVVENLDPLTIRVYDCFECATLPIIGRSACAFDSGILDAIFSAHFNQEMEADEIKCYAKGDEYCCFEINEV
ncbi:MAG TPA: V4R domain-containing protein [Methanobacterium sp.]